MSEPKPRPIGFYTRTITGRSPQDFRGIDEALTALGVKATYLEKDDSRCYRIAPAEVHKKLPKDITGYWMPIAPGSTQGWAIYAFPEGNNWWFEELQENGWGDWHKVRKPRRRKGKQDENS